MNHKRRRIINFIAGFVVTLACIVILAISYEIKNHIQDQSITDEGNNHLPTIIISPSQTAVDNLTPSTPTTVTEVKFLDLQPTVDNWLKTLSSNEQAGIMIYDLNNNRVAASYNENQIFNVASIYKLLFAYDGYIQLTNNLENPNRIITTTKDKGTLTLSQCLDLIIRESYNGCADILNKDAKRITRINQLIAETGMSNTSNIGLRSTATDITKLLRRYWNHTELNTSSWLQLSDSMLNQPPSDTSSSQEPYDWRQGLPAGFSDTVKVYNKVGWEWNGTSWNTYADAAILDFTNLERYYTTVVITKNLSNYTKITELGRRIEDAVELNSLEIIK